MQLRFLCSSYRRLLFGTVGGLTIALAIISTAWACTVFYGNITISGNGIGNVQHTITGDPGPYAQWEPLSPQGTFMDWCNYDTANDSNGNFWTAMVDDSSPHIWLTVSADTTSDCDYESLTNGNKLPASNTYTVATHDRFMGVGGTPQNAHNCHGQPHGDVLRSQNFVVDSAGNGSGDWILGTPFWNGWSSICVYLEGTSSLAGFVPGIASNFMS